MLSLVAKSDDSFVAKPPTITPKAYILMDFETGKVIAEGDADEKNYPASVTKVMSAYVVFKEIKDGNLSMEDEVKISTKAWKTGGSRSFVEAGKKVKVKDLLYGMLIQSGNDATIALAERVGGTEEYFVEIMNNHAKMLGMTSTNFKNSTGLHHRNHYTTARDLGILGRAIISEFPDFYHIFSEKEFTHNSINQRNRNKLLYRDETIDGLKTGWTSAAKYCYLTSSKRGGRRLVAAILGSESDSDRFQDAHTLLNYGFRFFDNVNLVDTTSTLANIPVYMGVRNNLAVSSDKDLTITIPRTKVQEITANISIPKQLSAPIKEGEIIGTVTFNLDGEIIAESKIISNYEIPEAGFWKKTKDYLTLQFESH